MQALAFHLLEFSLRIWVLALFGLSKLAVPHRWPRRRNARASKPRCLLYREYIGIMEKKMETTLEYWGYIGIMEKKMETTLVYWGLSRDNGKENGNYSM